MTAAAPGEDAPSRRVPYFVRRHVTATDDVLRRHPRHVVLFALVAGLLAGGWAPLAVVPLALVAMAVARPPVVAVAAVLAVAVGALAGDARVRAIDGGRSPAPAGAEVRVRATLLELPRTRASGQRLARVRLRGGEVVFAKARRPWPAGVTIGDELAIAGTVAALGPFDELQRRRGAVAALVVNDVRATGGRRGGPVGAVDAVRRRAERGLAEGLPAREAALLRGMVLGQDDRIADDVRDDFERSGLAHLLAVSGQNVMLLAALVLAAATVLDLGRRTRLWAAVALIALYVPLAGAGASVQRAGVMGAAGLVAALAGRPASRWYALGLAAAVTLALNPYSAGEPGWQLSFVAVVALLALAPPLREALLARRVPRPVAEAAAITLAATLGTAPLLALHFSQVSLVSLPANLVAAPAVAPLMWLGMLATAAAQVHPVAALPFNAANAGLLGYLGWLAEAAASAPLATVSVGLGGPVGLVAAYLGLAVAIVGGRALWRRRARVPRWSIATAVAAAALVAAFLLTGPPAAPPLGAGEVRVSFLDVGQGDATLIQRAGVAVLVDTGPPGAPILRRLKEAGVRRLDALVITHAQADHEGNALEVVRAQRPRLVLDGGAGWPTRVQAGLADAVARVRARASVPVAGQAIRVGELELRVLWPPRALAAAPPEGDANDRAVVLHVRSGRFDLLLPADAESPVTAGLELPRVEALKVAHHGSADDGLPELLRRLSPDVAAIEVGERNTYGHPAPTTLRALRSVPSVYRTDRDGTVVLRVEHGRMVTRTHG